MTEVDKDPELSFFALLLRPIVKNRAERNSHLLRLQVRLDNEPHGSGVQAYRPCLLYSMSCGGNRPVLFTRKATSMGRTRLRDE